MIVKFVLCFALIMWDLLLLLIWILIVVLIYAYSYCKDDWWICLNDHKFCYRFLKMLLICLKYRFCSFHSQYDRILLVYYTRYILIIYASLFFRSTIDKMCKTIIFFFYRILLYKHIFNTLISIKFIHIVL